MADYITPGLHALFIWWFSTGVVFWLNGLPRHTFRWTMLGATALLGLGLYAIAASTAEATVTGAYTGFLGALAVWIWIEVGFYLGYVTGIRKTRCPDDCAGWRHFGHALQASLWHEIAILALIGLVAWLTWGAANQTALWTLAVLKWMHQSARLNVFLGVRNINADLLPPHMDFLRGFMRKREMNLLFPISVTLSTIAAVLIFQHAAGGDAFERTALSFVGMLMALAILEHWVLMLPMPAAALWGWALKGRGQPAVLSITRGRAVDLPPAEPATTARVIALVRRADEPIRPPGFVPRTGTETA